MKIKLAKKDVKTLGLLLLCFLFLYVATFMYMNESLFSYDHFRNALLSQSIAEHGEFTLIGTAYYKHTFFYYLVFAMPFLIFKTYAAQTYAMIIISLLALGFNYIFFKHNFSRRIALFTTLCLGLYSSYVYLSLIHI